MDMQIKKIRLRKFKSIEDSGELNLGHITILAGQNNTGKTAFIDGVHRFFHGGYGDLGRSNASSGGIDITVQLEQSEQTRFFLGIDETFWGSEVTLSLQAMSNITRILTVQVKLASGRIDIHRVGEGRYVSTNPNFDVNKIAPLFETWYRELRGNIMMIAGNREPRVNQPPKQERTLDSRADNLHLVYHTLLSNNREAFDKIESEFRRIFPDVRHIHSGLRQNMTNVEVEFEGNLEHVRLEDCGTGYTHILIMLCLMFTDERPIVLFDEPHAYLHP